MGQVRVGGGPARVSGLTRLSWCALVRVPDNRPVVSGPLARFRNRALAGAERRYDCDYERNLAELRAAGERLRPPCAAPQPTVQRHLQTTAR